MKATSPTACPSVILYSLSLVSSLPLLLLRGCLLPLCDSELASRVLPRPPLQTTLPWRRCRLLPPPSTGHPSPLARSTYMLNLIFFTRHLHLNSVLIIPLGFAEFSVLIIPLGFAEFRKGG